MNGLTWDAFGDLFVYAIAGGGGVAVGWLTIKTLFVKASEKL